MKKRTMIASYEKYRLRGAIKETMRNYNLRTISLANYGKYLGENPVEGIHSVRYNIMNGYIQMYGFGPDGRCGSVYESIDVDTYQKVYDTILQIIKTENEIPFKVKRNILVKVNR